MLRLKSLLFSAIILSSVTYGTPVPPYGSKQTDVAPVATATFTQAERFARRDGNPVVDPQNLNANGMIIPCENCKHTSVPATSAPVPTATGPVLVKGGVPLWNQRPVRDDMAAPLVADPEWKELAAAADAIIGVSSSWIPGIVFQAPDEYFDNFKDVSTTIKYQPFVRVESGNSNKAHVTLTLFARSNDPMSLNLVFDLDAKAGAVAWHQALRAAFVHEKIQQRLKSINPAYGGPFVKLDPKGNKFKTMALLEMLTGMSPVLAENPYHVDSVDLVKTSDKFNGINDLQAWLHKNPNPNVDFSPYNPTIVFSNNQKLQPITTSTAHAKDTYTLHDCRATAPDYYKNARDSTAHDTDRVIDDLYKIITWSMRLNFSISDQVLTGMGNSGKKSPEYYAAT